MLNPKLIFNYENYIFVGKEITHYFTFKNIILFYKRQKKMFPSLLSSSYYSAKTTFRKTADIELKSTYVF